MAEAIIFAAQADCNLFDCAVVVAAAGCIAGGIAVDNPGLVVGCVVGGGQAVRIPLNYGNQLGANNSRYAHVLDVSSLLTNSLLSTTSALAHRFRGSQPLFCGKRRMSSLQGYSRFNFISYLELIHVFRRIYSEIQTHICH